VLIAESPRKGTEVSWRLHVEILPAAWFHALVQIARFQEWPKIEGYEYYRREGKSSLLKKMGSFNLFLHLEIEIISAKELCHDYLVR